MFFFGTGYHPDAPWCRNISQQNWVIIDITISAASFASGKWVQLDLPGRPGLKRLDRDMNLLENLFIKHFPSPICEPWCWYMNPCKTGRWIQGSFVGIHIPAPWFAYGSWIQA